VAGCRVLDFGAGSGLVAIAAAQAGAAAVTAAEIDGFAAAAIALNAASNGVGVAVEIADLIGSPGDVWDVVLVGDMCYERPLGERLLIWLHRHAAAGVEVLIGDPGRAYFLAGRGVPVLLGDPGRNYLPGSGLAEVARYTVPTSRELEDRDSREAVVWRVLP
jgi:predicted nicotinamide N-methyase